ncbi:MAG: DUF58 domain-containing protein [Acetobacter aceti]|uniref:DUF58 domain-containing protein n=1 Tax=Acetobacter aceti TaxID=435 RepID=UPI001F206D30|nr:DUF58 domain-containing protein [Acetobacter aceti]
MTNDTPSSSGALSSGFLARLAGKMRSASSATRRDNAALISGDPAIVASEADRLASTLSSLVLEAERIATTVSAGLHGQRRSGPGETFWQYRPALPGEPVTCIDWRQSARSHKAYVRETEAEHAQTIYLWCDLSPSMIWSSQPSSLPLKRDRAILLLLAVASLLERSGERVRLVSPNGRVDLPLGAGRIASRIALALASLAKQPDESTLLKGSALPPYSQLVIASDLLAPDREVTTLFRQLAGSGVRAHILQIIDPAERDLPYSGRIRFEGLENEPDLILPAVETLRPDYAGVFARRQTRLRTIAEGCRHTFQPHQTDTSTASALLSLSASLSGHRGGGRP